MDDMLNTPSPPGSGTAGTSSSASISVSRRPPRKSTLTQQQKNQKRQRATQDQLVTLEVEFSKNPTPTAVVRERIAQDINMTERSVQIWFQNRRAKLKLLAKKSIESGEECDAIPETMRQYLAAQALDSGKPLAREYLGRSAAPMVAYGNGGMVTNGDTSQTTGKVVIHHLSIRSLSIGTWRRVGQNAMDLVIFYSPEKASFTYYIHNDSAGYKLEFPFAYIKNISLENGDFGDRHGAPGRPGGLLIELNRSPNFFMDSSGCGGWLQCGDFTEDTQASRVMFHHLGGNPKVLSGQLAKLISLDTFRNRHNPYDLHAIPASAPVSPIGYRPASQPNQMTHPHLAMFQENPFGGNLQPLGRGHKRTRSKSVPIAIDFSMLQSPMPSFHIQHPSTNMTDPSIFAPIPQHHTNVGPFGSNLRIDTSSSYGLDYRHHPQSAGTTTSPSEYASPSFFNSGAHMDSVPGSNFNASYGLPFLSPMMEHPNMIHPSVSPLSAISHGDPVIADHSPPLDNMHRSASADFLAISQGHQASISDDGMMLSEMYSKQNLNMQMHSPGLGALGEGMQLQDDPPSEDLDMHNMVSFGTIDPANLSPHISRV